MGAHPRRDGHRAWADVVWYFWKQQLRDLKCHDHVDDSHDLLPALTQDSIAGSSESSVLEGNGSNPTLFVPDQNSGHWKWSQDMKGKPFGWIADGQCERSWSNTTLVFKMPCVSGMLKVRYLVSYKNMGTAEVWLTTES